MTLVVVSSGSRLGIGMTLEITLSVFGLGVMPKTALLSPGLGMNMTMETTMSLSGMMLETSYKYFILDLLRIIIN